MTPGLAGVMLGALVLAVAVGVWGMLLLRGESRRWRSTVASMMTTPVLVEVRHEGLPTAMAVAHGLDAAAVDPLRRLVRVATTGREDTVPGRRARGSPDPEALATRRMRDQSIAGLALRLQTQYAERGTMRPFEECIAEATEMLNQTVGG